MKGEDYLQNIGKQPKVHDFEKNIDQLVYKNSTTSRQRRLRLLREKGETYWSKLS
jgi:hypothetical protein